ncbi:hypothetical protein ACFQT0_10920 [Hymenobacter humi]|uniref:Uncharacterized protein n=1 Tax=Hymenobacter humi TaxID=1411620 RepID=A0ABW2U4M1_9BACT
MIGPNDQSFQMQLNDAGLTVNGKRQPDELSAKYRKLMNPDGKAGQNYNLNISFTE